MGRRAAVWGVAALLFVMLPACAADRSALRPSGSTASRPAATVPATTGPAVAGPMTANQFARHMGLSYEDTTSSVLLSDEATLVRIWKDSHEVSVDGKIARLPTRSRRQGSSLIVPAETVSYLQRAVYEERKRGISYPAYQAKPVLQPLPVVRPIEPAPLPEPAPIVAPRPSPWKIPTPPSTAGDPAWAAHDQPPRDWTWIVLHHSDDTSGNLAKYDRIHVESNGWDECGYHFVIGNGSLSGDGEVEVGTRWQKQKHGAHAKGRNGDNRYNERGVGIVLVGDFERGRPTPAQMESLVQLCRWLMATYGIPARNVIGHCDCKPTCCPGKNFPWAELRRRL